ncbi:Fungalysin metallopeptidase-domain-containing protein [Coprinopsis sp. MPI-PUGE-AT-0042]|nr:Fungalysin metallopeptidase-domain-containing protein [Coprinopsis sp. MPI-PUGE-AT-0042]
MYTTTPSVQLPAGIENHFRGSVDKMQPPPVHHSSSTKGARTHVEFTVDAYLQIPNHAGEPTELDSFGSSGSRCRSLASKYKPKETEKSDALEDPKEYIDTTVAQLFYTTNVFYNIHHRYFSFFYLSSIRGSSRFLGQMSLRRGGWKLPVAHLWSRWLRKRHVSPKIVQAAINLHEDPSTFRTPPPSPFNRDGDLDASIIIIELTHNLSTRLTGRPLTFCCLGWGKSGGMGEGWRDFLATTIHVDKICFDYGVVSSAANRDSGLGDYVYSPNITVNPLMRTGPLQRVAATESRRLITPLVPNHGDSLSIQLVLNGVKLQPCRSTLFQDRDTIISAEQVLTGGETVYTLRPGFAEGGLGLDARIEGQWATEDYREGSANQESSLPVNFLMSVHMVFEWRFRICKLEPPPVLPPPRADTQPVPPYPSEWDVGLGMLEEMASLVPLYANTPVPTPGRP